MQRSAGPSRRDVRDAGDQMQRLMFARIELWIVLLGAILGFVGVMLFGYLVLDAERGNNRYGAISSMALDLAEIPKDAAQLLKPDTQIVAFNDAAFAGRPAGWNFPAGTAPAGPDGYLLLSRYDGTIKRHAIELVDMRTWTTVQRWVPDSDALLSDVSRKSRFMEYDNWDREHFREIHPWMAENGDLVVKDHYSPLFRIDACLRRTWTEDSLAYHHSTEADADGNLWVPALADPHVIVGVPDTFHEDVLANVGQDGRLLWQRSLADVMLKAGFAPRMFSNGMYNFDPLHLNDFEPVLADGPFWKKGDLLLSLRNVSMIVLYRPATDSVIWTKTGPWLSQHDVDIVGDSQISVYDNQIQDRGASRRFEDGVSDIVVYDLATDTVTRPWRDAMLREKIKTNAAGLFTALPGGSALVEDVTNARLLVLGPGGETLADYVNRGDDGRVYHLGWSRYIDRAYGDKALKQIREMRCET